MPSGTKVSRCVEHLKAKGTKGNVYAICQSATGQSYRTGRTLKHKRKKRIVPKPNRYGFY
jgi:hypothetical protein